MTCRSWVELVVWYAYYSYYPWHILCQAERLISEVNSRGILSDAGSHQEQMQTVWEELPLLFSSLRVI